MKNTVKIADTEAAARFCAVLTKQNIVFFAEYYEGTYIITITGY